MTARQKIRQAIKALNRLKVEGLDYDTTIADLQNKLLSYPPQDTKTTACDSPDQSAADDYLDHLQAQY